jgi:5,6-dimethylbenzimidazole synthase
MNNSDENSEIHEFNESDKKAIYRAIYERRDMRHFSGGTVSTEVLTRLLNAAHYAPSVGFMQPWKFIRISDIDLRKAVCNHVDEERIETANALGEKKEAFMHLKIQGILDAAEVLVVALREGREKHVFGRRTMPQMDLASAACAIQNLWLASRAEGLGMGWVSIFSPKTLGSLLRLPEGSTPIAILCLGPVSKFYKKPMLEERGWAERLPLGETVYENFWGINSATINF